MATAPPTVSDVLTRDRVQALKDLAARYGVKRLRLFGSYARGEATADSDLDLLIDIEYGAGVARRFLGFCDHAEALLGMRVDVLTEDGLDEILHARILREARPL